METFTAGIQRFPEVSGQSFIDGWPHMWSEQSLKQNTVCNSTDNTYRVVCQWWSSQRPVEDPPGTCYCPIIFQQKSVVFPKLNWPCVLFKIQLILAFSRKLTLQVPGGYPHAPSLTDLTVYHIFRILSISIIWSYRTILFSTDTSRATSIPSCTLGKQSTRSLWLIKAIKGLGTL